MRKHLLAAAAIVPFVGAPAVAADMAVKAPRPAPIVSDPWEGFYLGGDAGYGIGMEQLSASGVGSIDVASSHGFSGGLLGGYNHLVTSRFLLGIEGDVNWSHISHVENLPTTGIDAFTLTQNKAYSLRGRAGYLVTPGTLLYATGGWAWSQNVYSLMAGGGFESIGYNTNGPEFGIGVETMLGAGWSARIEYLEALYRTATINSAFVGPFNVRPDVGVGRAGLAYHFAGGGTASAWDAPPAQPSWNGFYVGGVVAIANATVRATSSAAPGDAVDGVGIAGVVPAVIGGYNWRVAPQWVVGIEGGVAPGYSTTDAKLDPIEGVSGRLGYVLTPATMVYGSAGWLGTGVRTLTTGTVSLPSQRVNALDLGLGVETALDSHWAARLAYHYVIAAPMDNITLNTNTGPLPVTAQLQAQAGLIGLVYAFDGR